ncbi:MAG: hypothetical protein IKX88_08945 [Thermoguttaceae bacterium]|nr:hypothetical protein [Thermoguttaceae bacterium]
MKSKHSCLIFLLTFVLSFVSSVDLFAFDELSREPVYYGFDIDGKPAPKRMTSAVAADRPIPIETEFIAKLYSFYSTNYAQCEPIENRERLFVAIARGEYETAIQEAKKGLKKYSPLGETFKTDAKSGTLYRTYLFLLATAHELNGDWREALSEFAILEGDDSVDFMFTEARILYATGNRQEAFGICCDATSRLSPLPFDSVFDKIEKEKEKFRGQKAIIVLFDDSFTFFDPEWVALWKLRDSCARVVCPELHFVALHPFRIKREGDKSFNELQRESFERFLQFIDEEDERRSPQDRRKWMSERAMRALHRLEELPYGCGYRGMGGLLP